MTRSMHSAMEDIGLDELWIAYPGTRSLSLAAGVRLLPWDELAAERRLTRNSPFPVPGFSP
jgi:hypothetical protein